MLKGLRPFLSSAKYSTLQVETSQKDAYYKRLGALKDDENIKPPGWDEAQPFENIPGPKPLPIIGNIWRLLVSGSLNMMQQDQMIKVLPKKYGPIVKISSILGRSDLIYLFDPDDMEYMLRNAGVFPITEGLPCVKYYREEVRKDKYQGFLGMVNLQSEEWYSIRTLVNKVMMHPKMVQQHTSNLNDIAKDLVNCIKYEKQKSGSNYVDITDYVYNTAIESVTAVILDKRLRVLDVNVDKNSDAYKFVQATRLHVDDMFYLDIIPYYRYLPSKRFKQYVKNMDIMMDVGGRYIEEVLDKYSKENSSDQKVTLLKEITKSNRHMGVILSIDTLAAGAEPISTTLGTVLYMLAKNPDIQKKLREEILIHFPNKNIQITPENIDQMTYLRAVIQETMRFVPISLGNRRRSIKDMVIKGYRIPKNSNISACHFYTCNFTDKYFKNPEKFIPDRWLRSNNDELSFKNINPFVYMPFGFGQRTCIGKRIAMMQLQIVLINMIRNYEFAWNQPDLKFGMKLMYGFKDRLNFNIKDVNY